MARVKKNVVTKGLSGKLGDDLVFRQTDAGTIVSVPPKKRAADSLSDKQIQQQEKFTKASVYAKQALLQPELKEAYKAMAKSKGFPSTYNAAVSDSLRPPEIESVDHTAYKGKSGDQILIVATDNFEVKEVKVAILNADDSIVEEGDALQQENLMEWKFTSTVEVADLTNCKILVKAYDHPKNETVETIEL